MALPVSIIAGGAGFIGVNLCMRLLNEERILFVIDNFCRGRPEYLQTLIDNHEKIFLFEADLSDRAQCESAFALAATHGRIDEVWHLAANSDIPAGVADADVDLKDTFITTAEILRCMKNKIGTLYFASSSAIYGDLGDQPLHEEIGPLLPISNYGSMKLASEALISAAVESYLERACLFRFPNVVGVPATHGVILDFIRKLKSNENSLEVLGDGSQRKAYLHVSDLVAAMLLVRACRHTPKTTPINIGPVDEGVDVSWIADQVVKRVAPNARIRFGIGNRGWVGDVPKFHYSTAKIRAVGWDPVLGSEAAVLRAIDEIAIQEGF